MKTERNTTAGQMLEEVADLVDGDRAKTHGSKLKNHQNIASLWSAYLVNVGGIPVTAPQVCDMMELLKVARRQGGAHNPDDYKDGAGYAAVGLEVAERLNREREISKYAVGSLEAELAAETFRPIDTPDAGDMAKRLAPWSGAE